MAKKDNENRRDHINYISCGCAAVPVNSDTTSETSVDKILNHIHKPHKK